MALHGSFFLSSADASPALLLPKPKPQQKGWHLSESNFAAGPRRLRSATAQDPESTQAALSQPLIHPIRPPCPAAAPAPQRMAGGTQSPPGCGRPARCQTQTGRRLQRHGGSSECSRGWSVSRATVGGRGAERGQCWNSNVRGTAAYRAACGSRTAEGAAAARRRPPAPLPRVGACIRTYEGAARCSQGHCCMPAGSPPLSALIHPFHCLPVALSTCTGASSHAHLSQSSVPRRCWNRCVKGHPLHAPEGRAWP